MELFQTIKNEQAYSSTNGCRVSFVSKNNELTSINRIMYITDIRYCDMMVIKSLIETFRPFNSEIIFIHLTARGLPDMEDVFVKKLFISEIVPLLKYSSVKLINLKGKNTVKEMENIVNVMNPNIIALTRRKHGVFDRLFSSVSNNKKLEYNNIPLLVFDC